MDLNNLIPISQPHLSQHMAVLKQAEKIVLDGAPKPVGEFLDIVKENGARLIACSAAFPIAKVEERDGYFAYALAEEEAKVLAEILKPRFEVTAACCKTAGIEKEALALEKIIPEYTEAMCNPVGALQSGYRRKKLGLDARGKRPRE